MEAPERPEARFENPEQMEGGARRAISWIAGINPDNRAIGGQGFDPIRQRRVVRLPEHRAAVLDAPRFGDRAGVRRTNAKRDGAASKSREVFGAPHSQIRAHAVYGWRRT